MHHQFCHALEFREKYDGSFKNSTPRNAHVTATGQRTIDLPKLVHTENIFSYEPIKLLTRTMNHRFCYYLRIALQM